MELDSSGDMQKGGLKNIYVHLLFDKVMLLQNGSKQGQFWQNRLKISILEIGLVFKLV